MTKTKIRKDFRLNPTLVKWLKRYAKKYGLSETEIVEEAIAFHMQRTKDANASKPR